MNNSTVNIIALAAMVGLFLATLLYIMIPTWAECREKNSTVYCLVLLSR